MNISAIALGGLKQAQVQLESAASTLAGEAGSPSLSSSDSVDLSAGIVALMSAKNDFAVNISVMKTADQIQKYAIDLMA
jgi:flagellar hook protein FlgE